ncbi:MAG: ornithine carbamoyltransferase, partial [Candidatus Micrarchaeota archaeon]
NALSDLEHPCQTLADIMTIKEIKGWEGTKVAYVGDGSNVGASLMLGCTMAGIDFSTSNPKKYPMNAKLAQDAGKYAQGSGSKLEFCDSPIDAAKDADVVYADAWVSMGEEHMQEEKIKELAPYQVNEELMKHAKGDAVFMHDLPAHKGWEVTKEVIEGKQSVVFQQAENRMHAQKALMLFLLGKA